MTCMHLGAWRSSPHYDIEFCLKVVFFWKVLLNIFDQWPVLAELILRVWKVSIWFSFAAVLFSFCCHKCR